MKTVHLVIPDLFLPKDIAAEVCADLPLPALEKLLGSGHHEIHDLVALEDMLGGMFGTSSSVNAPIAAVSALFDGLGEGCWLRADPVHLRLQRDQMLALAHSEISADEAGQMCASLNQHFAGQGMEFFAPHPHRWYVRLDSLPDIRTRPISQVIGRDMKGLLPAGAEAPRWNRVFNEIQMLLFAHPLNETRAERDALEINSLWLWGGGTAGEKAPLQENYNHVSSDEVLVEMFANAAGIPFSKWTGHWSGAEREGRQLLVWTGLRSALQSGDLAAWGNALLEFESGYARPLWQALRSGRIGGLQMDIPGNHGMRRVVLKRFDTWSFWRRARRLAEYSMV